MIPKVIHYCWFGRNQLPKSAVRCINSWRKFLPDYEIKEWNEDNFDVNIIAYTSEAYKHKKYAFVSDYARFWILFNYGGLYFDTDVEIIKNIDHIISKGPFMGFEQPSEYEKKIMAGVQQRITTKINPGLGLGVNANHVLYKEMIDYYQNLHFVDDKGNPNPVTIVTHTTNILKRYGLKCDNSLQQIAGIWIYPWDVFCPQSYYTKITHLSKDSVAIHLYSDSWSGRYGRLKKKIIRLLGDKITKFIVMIKHCFQNHKNIG